MRAVLQRVTRAAVRVDGEVVGAIDAGLFVLLGVATGDTAHDAERLATKTAELRIFSDEAGRFNRSLVETGASALVVSQFTLLADARRGRRPGFDAAARPEVAEPLVETFAATLERLGLTVARGRFGAKMEVELVNDGPVTLQLER